MLKQYIIEMTHVYPFGQLGQALSEDTQTLVKKTLVYESKEEYEMIKQIIYFLKVAKHDSLINIAKVLENQGQIQLHYEYAPLRLEKWVVEVDQDLMQTLQLQMLDLAEYLARSSIKFSFDPSCIGLSKEMNVKYFLNEFSLDFQINQDHSQQIRHDIYQFFHSLSGLPSNQPQSQDLIKCPRLESLSTNASISPLDQLVLMTESIMNLKIKQEKGVKGARLSSKVENSMKKSLDALMRFKRMNNK